MYSYKKVTHPDIFLGVLSNMARLGWQRASVKFGNMGDGKRPNYQITEENGAVHNFGGNHKPYAGSISDSDKFKPENMSPSLALIDVVHELLRTRSD